MKTQEDVRASIRKLESEILAPEYHCTMWMLTCGELVDSLEGLAANGCDGCRKAAVVLMRIRALRQHLTHT